MPDSQTPNVKLIKPEIGGSPNTWGNKVNDDMDKIDTYVSIDRTALQTALQTGSAIGIGLPDIDGTDPRDLATNEDFRTCSLPLFYADNVVIPADRPYVLVTQRWVKQFIDAVFPIGVILPFYGVMANIPAGWRLCNGTTSAVDGADVTVPDLRGRFILGAWPGGSSELDEFSIGGTAGSFAHTHVITVDGTSLAVSQLPPHRHGHTGAGSEAIVGRVTSGMTYQLSGGTSEAFAQVAISDGSEYGLAGAAHNHTASSAGNTIPPPYYALCYIMKVKNWGYIPP